ncbi:hypothetical protein [Pseudonocardia humida]|uniref:Uncharacterized protein n=1 Tax=Pseudonocardia humida TaxID=2800819 RepID=A0ABT1ADB7_9PSEU|nr:hypothetical protein [Pseudonocardia humida]MCO1660749.1 hypothetical protein [Pseudonocardia humida]
MKIFYEIPSHGTRLSFAGMSKPLAQGVRAWRQRPTSLPVSVGTGIAVSTTDNCTRVSEVEHRHT